MIEVRDLTVTFGRTVALDRISVTFGEGVTGLFGQNGSGKSTLLRAIAGLQRPAGGAVLLDGAPAAGASEELRRAIGYAGHSSGLYRRLTLAENLALFARLYDVSPARADEVIEQVALHERAGTLVGELSAGLRRRAALARALLHEPRFLLLDEPYANLDDEASAAVSDAIAGWNRSDRVAIVASHGAKKVKAYARAGVILQRGSVVRAGSYVPVPS